MGMCGNRICGQVGKSNLWACLKIKFVGMWKLTLWVYVEIEFVGMCGNRICGHAWKLNLWACVEIEFVGMWPTMAPYDHQTLYVGCS